MPNKEKKMSEEKVGRDFKKLAESEPRGVYLKDLLVGQTLEVVTQNTIYFIESREDGFYISGHPQYCPIPTKVSISGSSWGGNALKMGFVGEGMHLEFVLPEGGTVTTSMIASVKEVGLSKTVQ